MSSTPKELTLLLSELNAGNKNVINDIFSQVYNELRKIASRYLYEEHEERTIQTTELVHEAYIKIIGGADLSIQNKSHFFGIAANAMRQLLVDFARKRNAEKRGGNKTHITLPESNIGLDDDSERILELDRALSKFSTIDERLSKIVELRFFAGLNVEETANIMGCSASTIKREWSLARAWLYRELEY